MPLPYDATVKDLAQVSPRGLLETFDAPTGLPVALLNIDLSTVTTSADLVFGLGEPLREIVHLDFQASASATKHADILVYNALLHRQYRAPVHSIAILLRPQAVHPNLDGSVAYAPRSERGKMDFGYEVVRLWERPALELLAGDAGASPLAVLGKLPAGLSMEAGMSAVVGRLMERLERELPKDGARRLLTASYVLSGLRLDKTLAHDLFKGAKAMRESVTYQAIVEEGVKKGRKEGREKGREEGLQGVRKLLLFFGAKKLGPPSKRIIAEIGKIADETHLERLAERIDGVKSWKDLLQE